MSTDPKLVNDLDLTECRGTEAAGFIYAKTPQATQVI